MADNTTTTTPQSNGVPLSGLPALTTPVNGEELLLITKDNQSLKTTAAALKAYINAEMATLTGMQQAVKAVSDRIDTLVNGDASSAIDTFNEIEAFLTGITDTKTLTGLLAELKSTITAETDNKLNSKVDKIEGKGLSANDYTDPEKAKLGKLLTNEQFGHVGFYHITNGALVENSLYHNTGLIALNREYALTFNTYVASTAASVCFYDATGTFISSLQVNHIETTVAPEDFPANAALIALNTRDISVSDSYYSNGPTMESRENATVEAIAASKLALFVDQFNAAAGTNGKYDPKNAPDPQHPFYLNTLWLTYEDAARVLRNIQRPPYNVFAANNDIPYLKTNIFTGTGMSSSTDNPIESNTVFADWVSVEVINLSTGSTTYVPQFEGISTFRRCVKLREIIGPFTIAVERVYAQTFQQCAALVDMKLHKLAVSIYLADSPLLSLSTMQYLVANAANTSEITVTVHPDVYAKLSGDTTNAAAAALTADELAAWQAVMTSAASRNIAFATTE